jgi:antitoxin HicB
MDQIFDVQNPRSGSSFDSFLREQGIYEEVHAEVLKRAAAEILDFELLQK